MYPNEILDLYSLLFDLFARFFESIIKISSEMSIEPIQESRTDMWQSPHRRKNSDRKKERDLKRGQIHVSRVVADIKQIDRQGNSIGDAMEIRLLLNEFTPTGLAFFSTVQLPIDELVLLSVQSPQALTVRARVVSCRENPTNVRILSKTPFPYRVGVEFAPATAAEEDALKAYSLDVSKSLYGQGPSSSNEKVWWKFY